MSEAARQRRLRVDNRLAELRSKHGHIDTPVALSCADEAGVCRVCQVVHTPPPREDARPPAEIQEWPLL